MNESQKPHVAIIGAGFCGLAAAYELSKLDVRVSVFEGDTEIGGLAGSFTVNGVRLEKFYHHWFTNDMEIMKIVDELGRRDEIVLRPTRTGMYYAHQFFKLSTPLDVLRFKPIPLFDRIRLGILALRVRRVKNWRKLENVSAADWLRRMGGDKVYEVVWEPLLRGKFGDYATEVSAVWFWNKLKLRGGSRGKGGEEQLAYYKGGFATLADHIATEIESAGGRVHVGTPVESLAVEDGRVVGVTAGGVKHHIDAVIATPALPIVADLLEPHVPQEYTASLRRIRYLANVCVVLELDRSLSKTYWLNVNDPEFPFVGVIEHTNFEPDETYGGRKIVYLSKYLPESDRLYRMSDEQLLEYTLPYLKRMFPAFSNDWIQKSHVWRACYSQPIVERDYSSLIPPSRTPLTNCYLSTMAQIYPEDRGTNYAIREGRKIGAKVAATF